MRKIRKNELIRLHDAVKALKTVDGELRYKMIANYLVLKRACENLQKELDDIRDLVKEQVGLSDEHIRTVDNAKVNHAGTNEALADREKEALILLNDFNRRFAKDIEAKNNEEVELDIKAITMDELKTLAKDEKLTIEVEGLLMQYLVE